MIRRRSCEALGQLGILSVLQAPTRSASSRTSMFHGRIRGRSRGSSGPPVSRNGVFPGTLIDSSAGLNPGRKERCERQEERGECETEHEPPATSST